MLGGQMGEKGSDFRFSHFLGVAFMMKKDILENPANIAFFGLVATMSSADNIAHLIEEFFSAIGASFEADVYLMLYCTPLI